MKLKTMGVVSSLAIMTSMTAPAFAQDEENENSGNRTNEIIVTAEFREANLQDTPIAITAVNAEMLDARGQTDISQVAANAPNVTLKAQPQGGGTGLIAFIRGVGQTDFNYALDPGVGVYIDDVYIPTLSSSLLDLMDLDRIEVLRGPQGTLAGKNSIGGAIKLFSAKPDGSGKGSVQATYGSYNRLDLRATADFAVTDKLFARVAGVSKSRDGYVHLLNYGLTHPGSNLDTNAAHGAYAEWGTLGDQNYVAGKLALRWMPIDTVEVNLSGDYTNDKGTPGPQVLLWADSAAVGNDSANADGGAWLTDLNGNKVNFDCRFVPYQHSGLPAGSSCDTLSPSLGYDPRFVNYGSFLDNMDPTTQAPYKSYAANPIRQFTGWGIHGNVTVDASDNLQIVWISSWREYTSKWAEDQDGSPVPVAQLDNEMRHRAWSQELRLNGKLGGDLFEYTLGGFYFDQDGSYTARVDLNYAGIDFVHGPDTTPSTSKAVFFNGTLHPSDAWSISGGIRHSWDEKIYTYYRSNPDGTVPGPLPCAFFLGAPTAGPTGIGNDPNCLLLGLYGEQDSFKGQRWDWRLVTDYRFSDQFLAYASISTGYKGGGVNPRPFFGSSSPNNQLKSFNPETITTYEIGFKGDFLDRRLRVNGAGFFNKYNDIILTLTACPISPCLQPNNVGKADVKGFELEVSAYPVDGLSLDGSLSYINFKYKDTGTSGVPLTATTPFTPEWTYSFGIQYDHELKSGATISARFDGSYQSDIYSEAFNTVAGKVDGTFLGNGRLSYATADENWKVSLEVQNIFNKYYFLSKSDITTSLGAITAQPGLPRTWAVTVKRNF
ncbi:MAG TPA: TonB-dependent receptor [Sphingomonadaceae bacterium]|nr:TonB-dependent receptor [Sphingomonadaceae bacterium]